MIDGSVQETTGFTWSAQAWKKMMSQMNIYTAQRSVKIAENTDTAHAMKTWESSSQQLLATTKIADQNGFITNVLAWKMHPVMCEIISNIFKLFNIMI